MLENIDYEESCKIAKKQLDAFYFKNGFNLDDQFNNNYDVALGEEYKEFLKNLK